MFWRSSSPQCLGSAPFLCFSSGDFHIHLLVAIILLKISDIQFSSGDFHIHPIYSSTFSFSNMFCRRNSTYSLPSPSSSKLFYLRYSIFCLKIQPNRLHHHLRPTPWAEKSKVSMVDTLKVASVQLENDLHLNDCFCFSELLNFF